MARYQIDNMPSPINFQESDTLLRTIQNAKNLLMCRMGEVPYDRYRGFDASLFNLPMAQFREELMPELDRVMEWEPDVEVVSATATLLDGGDVRIEVILEINIEEEGG